MATRICSDGIWNSYDRRTVEQEVLAIDESTELEFKDDESKSNWEKWVQVNSKDGYALYAVTYARRWAKYMQYCMKKYNKTLPQIADKASNASDIDGISGFMYGCAVAILVQCWKYGEELCRWHNKGYGEEGVDRIVNPAVINA